MLCKACKCALLRLVLPRYVFIWFDCLSFNIGGFEAFSCRSCAFAVLLSLSYSRIKPNFRPCWLFGCSGVFSIGLTAFIRLQAILEPFAVFSRLGDLLRLPFVRPSCVQALRSVRDGRAFEGIPPTLCARVRGWAVLLNHSKIKNIYSKP